MRVAVDTDPGLDDAIAILFALAEPALDVAAITTVAGNVGLERTTANALSLAAVAGRAEVPVHAGAAAPLARQGRPETRIHGADGLGGVPLPPGPAPDPEPAVAALARLAAEGPLDILAFAPLTNLAQALALAPGCLGRVIAMGGVLETHGNAGAGVEFNLGNDPEAARAVLSAGLDLTLIPLDVTRRIRADRAFVDRLARAESPRARTVAALLEAYFTGTDGSESRPLHDPCVPLLALAPELFETERLSLDVDLTERPGALIPGPHPVTVARDIDAPAALARLAAGLGG